MRTHFLVSAVAAALALTNPAATLAQSATTPARASYVEPLTPENSYLVLVDLQDMFGMTIGSIEQTALLNNAIGVTKAAKVFNVPTVFATANARTFGGPFFPAVTEVRKDLPVYDRTAINLWEDQRVVDEIKRSGRKKIIIGGLWTANCVMLEHGLALHVGEVAYGNVGASHRLDFTVIGPAVNRASRLLDLAKRLKRPVLVSHALAREVDQLLVDLGRHQLRDVEKPQRVFTLPEQGLV